MKMLPQEQAIMDIFNIVREVRPAWTFPDMCTEVQFVDTYSKSGSVYKNLQFNYKVFTISIEANLGDMSIENEYFVETVLHELVHWNGIWNHKEQFYIALFAVIDAFYNKLKERGTRNATTIREEQTEGQSN